jgi:hypothetical protein
MTPGFGTLAADFEQVTAVRFGVSEANQVNGLHQQLVPVPRW